MNLLLCYLQLLLASLYARNSVVTQSVMSKISWRSVSESSIGSSSLLFSFMALSSSLMRDTSAPITSCYLLEMLLLCWTVSVRMKPVLNNFPSYIIVLHHINIQLSLILPILIQNLPSFRIVLVIIFFFTFLAGFKCQLSNPEFPSLPSSLQLIFAMNYVKVS